MEYRYDVDLVFCHGPDFRTPIEEAVRAMAQLALAWCLMNPHVSTVITGASKVSPATKNMKALEVVPKLTPDSMARIEAILQNKPEPAEDYR